MVFEVLTKKGVFHKEVVLQSVIIYYKHYIKINSIKLFLNTQRGRNIIRWVVVKLKYNVSTVKLRQNMKMKILKNSATKQDAYLNKDSLVLY